MFVWRNLFSSSYKETTETDNWFIKVGEEMGPWDII